MWVSTLALVAATLSLSDAAVIPPTHIVHEKRDGHSSRWTKQDRALAHATVPMRIGLAQTNMEAAHEYLLDISHPTSQNYGKHWTSAEVINAFSTLR